MAEYDMFAEEYAKNTELTEQDMRKSLYTLLPTNLSGARILDVGCGSGHDVIHFTHLGADVCGIDISGKEISMARKQVNGQFIMGRMECLPYEDQSFDYVVSTYALQNSEDVKQSLLEMIRVVKTGGILSILTKHPFRNLLESYVNDSSGDYYAKKNVTSFIFDRAIKLTEPGHTIGEYLSPDVLRMATLECFEEHTDFPASEQVISGLIHPTYMLMRFRKNV